jgi:hypothetical protein
MKPNSADVRWKHKTLHFEIESVKTAKPSLLLTTKSKKLKAAMNWLAMKSAFPSVAETVSKTASSDKTKT